MHIVTTLEHVTSQAYLIRVGLRHLAVPFSMHWSHFISYVFQHFDNTQPEAVPMNGRSRRN